MRRSARAKRRPPVAASSAPSITARRDARSCVSAVGTKFSAEEGRMQFGPILVDFIISPRGPAGAAFSVHSWLYCRLDFGYQAPRVSRSRRISHGESRLKAPFGSHWSRTRRTRDNRNGSSDCIDPAVGPGVDRWPGRWRRYSWPPRRSPSSRRPRQRPRRNRPLPRNRHPRHSRLNQRSKVSLRNPDSSRRAVSNHSSCIRRG